MRRGPIAVLTIVAVAAVLVAGVLARVTTTGTDPAAGPTPGTSGTPVTPAGGPVATTPEQAAVAFLDDYVDPDGRVVRRDQGGDTVSEGQAYAMLIAVAADDRDRFGLVWDWTRNHLLRPDGLLSWRWAEGAVVDAESAADADLDAARALVLAGRTFRDPALVEAGSVLATAILDHETVMTAAGRILTAGSWADTAPYGYNPSYASPAATAVLAEARPDPRWAALDRGTRTVTTTTLTDTELPPDWAQVHRDGTVDPMPGAAGRGEEGVRYGYDATRLPLRFAESCDRADVALAARLVIPLERFRGAYATRDLGGQPLAPDESVVAAAGQAAAAAADGDSTGARALLDRMAELEQRSPTYYGAAWNALGRIMLTTDTLGGCPAVRA